MCYLYFFCLHCCLINIHIFDYPDSRLSGLFTEVPTSPDNRGSTVLKNVITCAFSSLLEGCTDSLIEKKNTKINRDCMTKHLKLILRDFGIKIENIISMNGF